MVIPARRSSLRASAAESSPSPSLVLAAIGLRPIDLRLCLGPRRPDQEASDSAGGGTFVMVGGTSMHATLRGKYTAPQQGSDLGADGTARFVFDLNNQAKEQHRGHQHVLADPEHQGRSGS